jgi:hypothetical protein
MVDAVRGAERFAATLVARYLDVNRCTSHRRFAARGQRFSSLLMCQRRYWVNQRLRQGL